MEEQQARAVEAMMAVSRTLTAIVARTLHDVADQITVPQLRALVLLSSRGPMNLSSIARHLDVNPSNASRTCDQLVASGRVVGETDPDDARRTVLRLTPDGARFVADLMSARRRLITDVVARMDGDQQRVLADGLEAFSSGVAAAPADEAVALPNGQVISWLM